MSEHVFLFEDPSSLFSPLFQRQKTSKKKLSNINNFLTSDINNPTTAELRL